MLTKFRRVEALRKDAQPVIAIVRHVPEAFLVVALTLITINDLVQGVFNANLFDSGETLKKLAAPLILAALIIFTRLIKNVEDGIKPLHKLAMETVEVVAGEGALPYSDLMRMRFQIDVLTLAGGVILPLDDEQVVKTLSDPRRMSRIRCLIANPYSEDIINRYKRDEPEWKHGGAQEIENRLIWLFNLIERSSDMVRSKLHVRVYDNYPMLSIFRADDSVYSSYYAYKLRGSETPMILSDVAAQYGRAVMKHFEKLYDDSVSLTDWMVLNYHRLTFPSQCHFGIHYSGIFLETKEGDLILQKRDARSDIANPAGLSVFGGRRISVNETSRATAVRELREETDLLRKERDLIALASLPYSDSEAENNRCMLCSYFLIKDVNPSDITVHEGALSILKPEDALETENLTQLPREIIQYLVEKRTWPTPETFPRLNEPRPFR